MTAGEVRRAR